MRLVLRRQRCRGSDALKASTRPIGITEALLGTLKQVDYGIQIWATKKLEDHGDKSVVPVLVDRLTAADYSGYLANKEGPS